MVGRSDSMDPGGIAGTEACQEGLSVEESSVGSGTADTDGTRARGAERVGVAQGAQVVGRSDSMDSGGITGVGTQPGAAEDLTPRRPPPSNKPAHWATMTPAQRRRWKRIEKNRKERDQDGEGGQ